MMRHNASETGILNKVSLIWAKWVILGCKKDKLLSLEEGWISSLTVWATGENDILPYKTEQTSLIVSENPS